LNITQIYAGMMAVPLTGTGERHAMGTTAYLYDKIFLQHKPGLGHPERPERLNAIHGKISGSPFYRDLLLITPEKADRKFIELNHGAAYIDDVREKIENGTGFLDMDTGVSAKSFEAALQAVGGSLKMCDAVMGNRAVNGFCAVRPPGHHAEYDYASGFCIFNNIAIAARYLRSEHGLKRIAIVDWDVHHGNGTQHSFEGDDFVYYISLHQNPLFPGTGTAREKGYGQGTGYTLNIPMEPGRTDEDYLDAFHGQIIPALDAYRPEIVLVSAGFDAHHADPLASIMLSTEVFHTFTKLLMGVAERHCGGKVISFLEGGYNLDALSDSVMKMMEAFVSA
jgi:acetoin utilization deacetylase AcuC-like enzyme